MVRRAAATALVLLALGSLTGCGNDLYAKSDPPPAGREIRASADLGRDQEARRRTRQALQRFLRSETGSFTTDYAIPDALEAKQEGRYDLSTGSWELAQEVTAEGVTTTTWFRSVEDRQWMRLAGGTTTWPCWMDVDDLFSADEAPVVPSYPVAVTVASRLQGRETFGSRAIGTTPLAEALLLVSNQVDLEPTPGTRSAAKVVADVFITADGALAGLDIRLSDLFAGWAENGDDLPFTATTARNLPGALRLRFTDLGEPVTIAPPTVVAGAGPGMDEVPACDPGWSPPGMMSA